MLVVAIPPQSKKENSTAKVIFQFDSFDTDQYLSSVTCACSSNNLCSPLMSHCDREGSLSSGEFPELLHKVRGPRKGARHASLPRSCDTVMCTYARGVLVICIHIMSVFDDVHLCQRCFQ